MLWVLRLALCATLAVLTAPKAHGGAADGAAAGRTALTQSNGAIAKAEIEPDRTVMGLILPTGSKAFAQPLLQGVLPTDRLGLIGSRNAPPLPGGRSAHDTFGEPGKWASEDGGIHYSVSPRVSFGLNYRRLTEEDLKFEVAETGSLESGYDSHSFVLQARWEF
jgi:hypothetical protein